MAILCFQEAKWFVWIIAHGNLWAWSHCWVNVSCYGNQSHFWMISQDWQVREANGYFGCLWLFSSSASTKFLFRCWSNPDVDAYRQWLVFFLLFIFFWGRLFPPVFISFYWVWFPSRFSYAKYSFVPVVIAFCVDAIPFLSSFWWSVHALWVVWLFKSIFIKAKLALFYPVLL